MSKELACQQARLMPFSWWEKGNHTVLQSAELAHSHPSHTPPRAGHEATLSVSGGKVQSTLRKSMEAGEKKELCMDNKIYFITYSGMNKMS